LQKLPIQASLAKEVASAKKRDDGFLAVFGKDSDLDRAADDVKKRVGGIALRVDNMPVGVFQYGSAMLGDKSPKIEAFVFVVLQCHGTMSPFDIMTYVSAQLFNASSVDILPRILAI
jgi:hypothetical protein